MPFRTTQIHALTICILSTIVVVFIGLNGFNQTSSGISRNDPQNDDGWQNLTYAYNLSHYGIFSLSGEDNPNIRPDYFREPVYPALMALSLALFGNLDSSDHQCFIAEPECGPQRLTAKRIDALLLLALTWVVAVAAFRLTGRWPAVYLAVGLLLSANFFFLNSLFSEIAAALFLLLHAWLLYEAFQARGTQRRMRYFAFLSSVALGLLILTKAIFLYWLITLLVGLVIYAVIRFRRRRSFLAVTVLLVLPAIVLANLWMLRNFTQFGKYTLTNRGAIVLAVRAEYSYMTPKEYLASFIQFSPEVIQTHLRDMVDMSRYYRLNRDNEGSYYQRTTRATDESEVVALAREQYGMSPEVKAHANDFVLVGMSEADDAALSAAAMRTILNRLDRHALLTLVFAYRGAFVKIDEYDFDWPNSPLQKAWLTTIRLVGLFFVPAMLWSAASALRKRQYALTLFFVPALFSYAFHAATTHYIARYSAPLVPIFIIALVMTIIPVLSWLRRKVSRKAGRERVNELAASD